MRTLLTALWCTAGCAGMGAPAAPDEVLDLSAPPQVITLEASALVPGEDFVVQMDVPATARVYLFVSGAGEGSGPCAPVGSACLDLAPTAYFLSTKRAATAGTLEMTIPGSLTATLTEGATYWFQVAGVLGNLSAVSNVAMRVVNDGDGDGVAASGDCDDTDALSTVVAEDGDCDGTLTAADCDDGDALSTVVAEDGDCDGTLTAADCDDGDALSTVVAEDGDCDGTLTAADCDDADALSTVVAEDGDCDGTLTAADCDDGDALSTVVAEDGDCDGVLTAADCDDGDAGRLAVADDGDCDGYVTASDCDDTDDAVYPGAVERCDGVQNDCSVSWTSDDGVVSLVAEGTWSDVSADFSAGTDGAPGTFAFSDAELRVCPGTYYVSMEVGGDALITGVGSAETVVLDGGGAARVLLTNGNNDLTIGDVTLQRGASTGKGGCAYISGGARLLMSSVDVADCVAGDSGGAMYVVGVDTVTMEDMRVSGNTSDGIYGGGLDIYNAVDFVLRDSTFENNVALNGSGGGLATYSNDTDTLTNVDFVGNTAGSAGGWSIVGGVTVADGLLVQSNTSTGVAGGLDAGGTSMSLTDSILEGNTGGYGGAMRVRNSCVVSDTSFQNNVANNAGGAIYFVSNATLDLSDSVVTGNEASGTNGAAIHTNTGATLTATDVTFANNTTYDIRSGSTYTYDATVSVVCDNSTCQ